jgi:3D (Asp-Asp-Asp) domain-containing protein
MDRFTAACGPELELGTVIVLENGMILKCLDRGGWITSRRLDIYFDSLYEAQEFGIEEIRGVVIR